MNSYYNFKPEDAYRFKNAINAKVKERNGQLEFGYCPYCMGGQNHDKGTFAISLSTGQFECKRSSCSVRGNMITLAKDFADRFELPKDVSTYYNINNAGNRFKRFKDAHRAIEVRDNAITYLQSRGISEDICKKYEVTTLPDQDHVLVFPFKDENGALQFIKYRNMDYNGIGNKEWSESGNCKKILFGMNNCEDFSTLVITEGQIDSLSCAAAGIKNAVSVPTGKNGFTWKPNVWDWLVRFEEIVVFGDNENGVITLAEEITGFYPKRVRVVRPADYQGCKDANELLQRCGSGALRHAVDNAEVKISFRIKDLADVEKVDLQKLKSYPTYFDKLDDAIGNGFHDSELIILTGKCGEGKSTFASMIVGRMIQNGLKCFCYSGELPAWQFKAWLDYQIAGTKDITEAKHNALDDWYRSKCYIYDNSAVIDEKEELFDVMGSAVRDLGCKFILIDNLMTAMEDKPQEDLFRQQSNFLGKLAKFAKGFNVIIMLVAHPKKGSDKSNDSISGSGDITNRANLVLRFQRNKDAINESLLMITKNRTTGKLNYDGIPVYYDDSNMRISEGSGVVEFIQDKNGFAEFDDVPDEVPF